jgi:hypothetical protein
MIVHPAPWPSRPWGDWEAKEDRAAKGRERMSLSSAFLGGNSEGATFKVATKTLAPSALGLPAATISKVPANLRRGDCLPL